MPPCGIHSFVLNRTAVKPVCHCLIHCSYWLCTAMPSQHLAHTRSESSSCSLYTPHWESNVVVNGIVALWQSANQQAATTDVATPKVTLSNDSLLKYAPLFSSSNIVLRIFWWSRKRSGRIVWKKLNASNVHKTIALDSNLYYFISWIMFPLNAPSHRSPLYRVVRQKTHFSWLPLRAVPIPQQCEGVWSFYLDFGSAMLP